MLQETETNIFLEGNVLWSYDDEVRERSFLDTLGAHVTFVKPFHVHTGEIILCEKALIIQGDVTLKISLKELVQIYNGFDKIFPPTLAKNFGLTWEPLRITLANGKVLYLIIDYSFGGTRNKLWFEAIKELLS